tara:strand:+ start:14517 stop:15842 length:1326 start_codon:yes stop_codon:yes gene_type:complete
MGANSIIQVRRGVLSDWSGINPTLAGGEIGYETDTKRGKIGDGSTAYLSLPYVIGTGAVSTGGGGAGTVTDAFKFINVTGIGGLTVEASGSGDTVNLTGIAPLRIVATPSTNTISFDVATLSTGNVVGFATGVRNVLTTEVLGGTGINLNYNAIDDALTINTSGVPLFESNGDLVLGNNLTVQNNATIQGNLTVQGSSITANSTNVNIGDNIITVNVTEAVASGGIQVFRSGTSPSGYASMLWNENSDRFIFSSGSGDPGSATLQARTFVGNLSGVVSGSLVGSVSGNANSATQLFISGVTTASTQAPVLLVNNTATGLNKDVFHDGSGLLYNTTTNALSATTFIGALSGAAADATQVALSTVSDDATYNVVLASGTGSPASLFTDTTTLSFNASSDMLFASGISGIFITGSPTLSLGIPNASYIISHFNLNNCRVDGGSP